MTRRFVEYPKWVGDKIVRNAAEEAELLGTAAKPEPAPEPEPESAKPDPLDHDGDGKRGGSKPGRKLHRKSKA